jgi:hypothetical protein
MQTILTLNYRTIAMAAPILPLGPYKLVTVNKALLRAKKLVGTPCRGR